MPTPEQIVQEDMMNNCGIRTVMSGVMGMGLGLVFGVVMGSMDAGVSVCIADWIGWSRLKTNHGMHQHVTTIEVSVWYNRALGWMGT